LSSLGFIQTGTVVRSLLTLGALPAAFRRQRSGSNGSGVVEAAAVSVVFAFASVSVGDTNFEFLSAMMASSVFAG
jgi:hypothetical protein